MVEIWRIVDFYMCMFNCVKLIHDDVLKIIWNKNHTTLIVYVSGQHWKKKGIKLLF